MRVTIAEIRKRIAQYYHEEAHETEMRIELLPGRYVPEFRPRREVNGFHTQTVAAQESVVEGPAAGVVNSPDNTVAISRWFYPPVQYGVWAIAVVMIAAAAYLVWRWAHPSALEQLWRPVLASKEPIAIYLPSKTENHEEPKTTAQSKGDDKTPSTEDAPSFLDYMSLGENVVFSDTRRFRNIYAELARGNGKSKTRIGYRSLRSRWWPCNLPESCLPSPRLRVGLGNRRGNPQRSLEPVERWE